MAAPTITSISPNLGSVNGGTNVIITGTNFTGSTAVTFGGTNATTYTVNSDTQITCVTPSRDNVGTVSVVVTNLVGSATREDGFTYYNVPTISSITPNEGSVDGTNVIIAGTNFFGVNRITFGGNVLNSSFYTVRSDTRITCYVPEVSSVGTVNVVVTNPLGSDTLVNGFTYYDPPEITSIVPNLGSVNGGTSVVITGINFISVSGVTFGSTNATSVIVNSAGTQITCLTPAGTVGSVGVRVTSAGGSRYVANGFTYVGPTITSISPNSSSVNGVTGVVITGTGFNTVTGISGVTFGGTDATTYTVNSDTRITCTAPAKTAGSVTVQVTNTDGSATLENGFTYYNAPTISTILPNGGSVNGGTSVIITGTSFTGLTGVTFGNTPAPSYTVNSSTQITCVTPAKTAGSFDVVVTTPNGSATVVNGFTYYNAPTISTILPNGGSVNGGTSVVITGTSFTGVTGVTFGNTPVTSYTVNSDTQITCVTRAKTAGSFDVVVTNPGGSATVVNGFTYYNSPTISTILPNGGSVNGGTSVIITGTSFTGVTGITFGGTNATSVIVNSAGTQITCVTPAKTVGSFDVVVTNPGGSATVVNGFTYYNAPTISTIEPNNGSVNGGTSVIITGTSFTGVTGLTFGGTNATSVIVNSAGTQITCVTPAKTAGTVDVVVTNPGGSATVVNGFTYYNAPTISTIVPNDGSVNGGTTVLITGTSFTGVTRVTFGDTNATSVSVNSAGTQITCVTPAGYVVGQVNFVVTNPGGSATTVNGFTYTQDPTSWATTGNTPQYLATDGTYIYCANNESSSISRISLTNPTTDNNPNWAIGINLPTGLAIDVASGILYCSYSDSVDGANYVGQIAQITLGNTPSINLDWKIIGQNTGPQGLAIDTENNFLYCANSGSDTISKISLTGGADELSWATLPLGSNPQGLAIDVASGYLYCANGGNNTISQITLTEPQIINNDWLINGISSPAGLVINGGFLYCVNNDLNTISKINLTNSQVVANLLTIDSPIVDSNWALTGPEPLGLLIDSEYIYESNFENNTIWKISLSTPCFNEGTKILCLNSEKEEEYIPIEDLKKGDLVKSYLHGYRKIDSIGKNSMINNPEHFNLSMYKMEKTLENGLTDDLIVTGGHSILVDDLGDYYAENEVKFKGKIPKIDDKIFLLCSLSKDFIQLTDTNKYTYYHLVLENNGNNDERFGIWANGILTETISKNQFITLEKILH
jgi:hypothetical protein